MHKLFAFSTTIMDVVAQLLESFAISVVVSITASNLTDTVFNVTYHGYLVNLTSSSSDYAVTNLQPLSKGLWLGFWKISLGGIQ
jgi:hypothetical protein